MTFPHLALASGRYSAIDEGGTTFGDRALSC
jgi:hypothetical protein